MARSRKFLTVGAMSVAALALIGAGAGATFNDSGSAAGKVSTGTLVMRITSVDRAGSAAGVVSNNGKSISFTLANSGSQISQKHMLTVKNAGTLPLTMSSVSVSSGARNNSPLANDVTLNLDGTSLSVQAAQASGWQCNSDCVLAVGASYTFPFNFTARLRNIDEGQSISPTLTILATEASTSNDITSPAGAVGRFVPVNG